MAFSKREKERDNRERKFVVVRIEKGHKEQIAHELIVFCLCVF